MSSSDDGIDSTHRSESGELLGVETSDQERVLKASCAGEVVTAFVASKPPRNEEGADRVSERVAAEKNGLGDDWDIPGRKGKEPADWEFRSKGTPQARLAIQVVRAPVVPDLYLELKSTGQSKSDTDCAGLTETVKLAIEHKRKRYSSVEDLVLVINGTLLPQLHINRFIEKFQSMNSEYLKNLEFKEVWLVGEEIVTEKAVWRLCTRQDDGVRVTA